MFKKIEIWVLYLVILLSAVLAVGFGVLVRQELVGNTKLGFVSKAALTLAEIPVNIKKLSYPTFVHITEDRFFALSGFDGTPNSEESYLLLSKYDGDLEEGVVELVDLTNFKVLQTWNPDIDGFNDLVDQVDRFKYLDRDFNNSRITLLHPKLTGDGGLLFNSALLQKIDVCSNLVFQNTQSLSHHSIETDIDGNIWVPHNIYPHNLSIEKVGGKNNSNYDNDAVAKLSPDGKILFEKSISQIFIDNDLEYLLFGLGSDFESDPIHLNDIQPVDFDGKYWKKGDVFLSFRHQSMILLYRPSSNEIIWKKTGPFFQQHDVDIIDDHRISVFNNNTYNVVNNTNIVFGNNEVIIYDFEKDQFSSYLSDSLIENDVRTVGQGRSQILPNGDLFVEETNYSRTLYFNKDGSLRWTHLNRAVNGNTYRLGWSRILYNKNDIETVNNLIKSKGNCDD
jgi:hypothetical protein